MAHKMEGPAKQVEYNIPGIRPVTVRHGTIIVHVQDNCVTIEGKDCSVTGHGEHQNIWITLSLNNCSVEWKEKPTEVIG